MRYRIDFYGDRRNSLIANNRKELTGWLKILHPNTIEDVFKLYSDGRTESIAGAYLAYLVPVERQTRGK